MTDVVDRATRSRMMSGIRGKNTRPEHVIRRGLHRRGFRFRLHVKDLPGKPDLALPRYRTVIEINGCFWHGHDCHLFRLPGSRRDFWQRKIDGNRDRDHRNLDSLHRAGWRTMVVWECALRGRTAIGESAVLDAISAFLREEDSRDGIEIEGRQAPGIHGRAAG